MFKYRDLKESTKKMTNFEKWKNDLTVESLATSLQTCHCEDCPAEDFCNSKDGQVIIGCEATVEAWANTEVKDETN